MTDPSLNGEVDRVLASREIIASGRGITGVDGLFAPVEEGTGLGATAVDEFFEGARGEEAPVGFEAQPREWTEMVETGTDTQPSPRGRTERMIKLLGDGSPLGRRPEPLL